MVNKYWDVRRVLVNKDITCFTRIIVLFLLMILFAFIILGCTSGKTISIEDDKIMQTIIQNERNLVLVQLNDLKIDDYKKEAKKILHSYFSKSYIEKIDAINKVKGIFAPSVDEPVVYQISRVYSGSEKISKVVFLKLPVANSMNNFYKMYFFRKEDGEWRLFQLREYHVITEGLRNENYKRIIDIFTNYEDLPIEYDYITIKD